LPALALQGPRYTRCPRHHTHLTFFAQTHCP
jgi:hypothetical protein